MRNSLSVSLVLVLAGCGGGHTDLAVQACTNAVADKLGADRNYRIDVDAMSTEANAAETDGADVVAISAPIVFDEGLPREYTQTLNCKARFAEGATTPDVIALTFTW